MSYVIHMSAYYLLVNEGLNIYDHPISEHVMPSSSQSQLNSCQKLPLPEIGRFLFLYENLYSRHEPLHFMDVTFREWDLVFLRRINDKVIGESSNMKVSSEREVFFLYL